MAETSQILALLEALATHCRAPLMSVEAKARWMRDWCDDLRQFEIDRIEHVLADWRRSGATKFPTPGQILGQLKTREVDHRPPGEPQRALTEAEYRLGSLTDKLRHHRLLADEANTRAATLWRRLPETRAGTPPSFVNWVTSLPAPWAEAREIEAYHLGQASEMRDRLSKSGDAA